MILDAIKINFGLGLLLLSQSHLASANDAFLWLEERRSPESLKWVEEHNQKTLSQLKTLPEFEPLKSTLREISFAKDRIQAPGLRGEFAYQFWQDEKNPKGIWRRTLWPDYAQKDPTWETILDIDQLSRDEKEDWVWKGPNCLAPADELCLIDLSRKGGDEKVVREFNTVTKTFVKGGFELPQAKSEHSWLDRDHLFIGTDFGPGSLTESGYPRIAKIWTRGTPLSAAITLYEGKESDLFVGASSQIRPEGTYLVLNRAIDFYHQENWIITPDSKGGLSLTPIPFETSVSFIGFFNGFQIASLRQPFQFGEKFFPAGSVVSLAAGLPASEMELIYAPAPGSGAVESIILGKNKILLTVLENVKGKLIWATPNHGRWAIQELHYPDNGVTSVSSYNAFQDRLMISYESYVTPQTLYFQSEGQIFKDATLLKQATPRYDATQIEVKQVWAKSKDGVQIPYFLIQNRNQPITGTTPTLLYGYGGFEISETPHYIGSWGKVWLEKGGALAFANIRGGGEFGPQWHEAAILKNKQKSYDDFIAVAESLIQTGITSPAKLAIMGGSNGGLLVGATFVQRPDLFKAVICQIPLLDMMRYHLLPPGKSWMAEYGDPSDPEMTEIIGKYSPYQNLQPGKNYPHVFFITSTADDRVNPAHARKMAARMEELGYSIDYFENPRGGHSGGADLEDQVESTALEFMFLYRELF